MAIAELVVCFLPFRFAPSVMLPHLAQLVPGPLLGIKGSEKGPLPNPPHIMNYGAI